MSDVPAKLRSKTAHMQASFDMHDFQPFFRWMFEMGKGISAMNTGAHVGAVRSVPIPVSKRTRAWPCLPARKAKSRRSGAVRRWGCS